MNRPNGLQYNLSKGTFATIGVTFTFYLKECIARSALLITYSAYICPSATLAMGQTFPVGIALANEGFSQV